MLRFSLSRATINSGPDGAVLGLPSCLTLGSRLASLALAAFYWRAFAP